MTKENKSENVEELQLEDSPTVKAQQLASLHALAKVLIKKPRVSKRNQIKKVARETEKLMKEEGLDKEAIDCLVESNVSAVEEYLWAIQNDKRQMTGAQRKFVYDSAVHDLVESVLTGKAKQLS